MTFQSYVNVYQRVNCQLPVTFSLSPFRPVVSPSWGWTSPTTLMSQGTVPLHSMQLPAAGDLTMSENTERYEATNDETHYIVTYIIIYI